MNRSLSVAESESDTNLTSRRAAWQAANLDGQTHALLARDSRAFLHQSVSTPCLNAIAKAEASGSKTWPGAGSWISTATTSTTSATAIPA